MLMLPCFREAVIKESYMPLIEVHVIENLQERLVDPYAKKVFVLPQFVKQMVDRGFTGEKAGQGFYKRIKNAAGESEILTLDPSTFDYRPRQSPKLGSI